MFELIERKGRLLLRCGETVVFEHTAASPFITALELGLRYKSTRGAFTVKTKRQSAVRLSEYTIERGTDEAVVCFGKGERSVRVTIAELEGAMRLSFAPEGVKAVELRLNAVPGEGIFGGGEQSRQLDLKGERVVNFVSEHTKLSALVAKTLLPHCLYRTRKHREIGSYAPMSTFVSSEHYALRFDGSAYALADFSRKAESRFTFAECPGSLLYVKADTFTAISRRLNADRPCAERLPAWANEGMILGVQGGVDVVMQKAFALQDAGAEICGVWCQDWSGQKVTAVGSQVYWNWEAHAERYHDLADNIKKLNERGIRFLAYINPYLVENGPLYNYCKKEGYLIRRKDGSIYHIKSTTFDAGMLDLTNPDAVAYIKETLITRNMLDLGVDGYMADFGEYLPVDCVLHDGDPELLHNEWPVMWARLNREAVDAHPRAGEIFFFTRSAYNDAQCYTTMMWNGDQHTDYSVDFGLPTVMPASFSLGFSGVTMVHSDVGGFFSFGRMKRDAQLYTRWMELCAFSPLMRGHESIRPQLNAQPDSADVLPYTVSLTGIHKRLKPYIDDVLAQAVEGVPAMRPDFYDGNEFSEHHDQYSYRMGDELFVCPVVKENQKEREVWLPEGRWTHLFTGEEYGGGRHIVPAPLGKPPVFYLAGGAHVELFAGIRDWLKEAEK